MGGVGAQDSVHIGFAAAVNVVKQTAEAGGKSGDSGGRDRPGGVAVGSEDGLELDSLLQVAVGGALAISKFTMKVSSPVA